MKLSEYVDHDGVGLAGLVARGEVTAAELAATARLASDAVNPMVNAVVETWPAQDAPVPGSTPLAGVPFLIKDLAVAMAGRRVELGSRIAAGNVARADSALMARFRRAGLVTLGRTATPEFAYSTTTEGVLYGATRNPWDPTRSPGGSSGGSGAAVAAGIVPIAHATDAAGSIRVPAAANGLFGLKPTRGRISMGPDADEVFNGLAVHGALSRSVRDSAALLDLVHGPEAGDPYAAGRPERPYAEEVTRSPGSLRIGLLTRPWGGRAVDAAVVGATLRAARLAESLGHRVEEVRVDLGVDWEEFVLANARLWSTNLATWIDDLAAAFRRPVGPTTLEPETLAAYAYGQQVSGTEFVHALAMRNGVARAIGRYFTGHDLLLTPTLPELPVPLGTYAEGAEGADGLGWLRQLFHRSPFTAAFNVAGTPAMSVPLETDPATGLPIGIQFAAGHGREDLLFRLAGQLERAAPWARRTPAVWAGRHDGA
ncbi:amidase [Streptomyces lavendulae subsp. lavendulae]|uniref:amidase n=1 Tax=Streptomyces lavendulae TaxID=1914 RepID=UPI0024A320D0|nr:amidase [Streptomyces lavendulae]GLV87686.1 amidase [Streptomyces lavendulae subsp. lavendulae]GLX40796.1 amidase [Streptomyces roseochromogenus]